MTLSVNDMILYGTDGVCKVVGKAQKKFLGKTNEYYLLQPVHNPTATIYIPVDSKKAAAKIRSILSIDEIHALIKSMPDEDTIWIADESKRKEEYRKILAAGDRMQLIRLIKTLYLYDQEKKSEGKKLHISDERFMKDAEKILYEEFAYVLDIKPDQVAPFITQQIDIREKI